ncbi:MAG: DUF1853 family protein [Cryobacterium sp.]|nr:DUF1853 family protein [Oligoflexia bacterium]
MRSPLENIDLTLAANFLTERLGLLKSSRIGLRFERIQEALFRAHPATSELRAGIVIPGRTEIDLLQKITSLPHVWFHWEVAVKFYLALDQEGSEDPDRWIGPTLRDTFGIKARTIFKKQLTILNEPEMRRLIGIQEEDSVIAAPYVRGILFLPWKKLQREQFAPPGLNPVGSRGFWVEESELADFKSSLQAKSPDGKFFYFTERNDWIRTHDFTEIIENGPNLLIETRLSRPSKADLEMDLKFPPFQGTYVRSNGHQCEGRGGSRGEEIRFFCVPDGWLAKAERALESMRHLGRLK